MSIKKFIKYTLIGLITIIMIGGLGLLVWSKTGTYPARMVALSALESTDRVTITHDEWIVFEPDKETETGLIFYPGGLVEPTAYAPILHQIAENGVLVIITPMPLNLAIFNTSAADAVINAYPQISNWVLAGHSLGGTSAAIFAENNPKRIDAIALWDSYPPDSADLSDNTISVISIFSATNNFPNTENLNDKKHLLPADTIFIGIEGANHAQFGDYGPQKGDVVASLSLTEQHEQVAEIMLDFINP
ncbi:MAG: alpha/beta hydrolase [Anaerolineales bacterium]|nr:MAG: alpha/beta hydrolase [Anaerolineales bacterium]